MVTEKSVREVFEETVFDLARDILGDDCPNSAALRNPRWRGSRFNGLTYAQRALIERASGIDVSPLFRLGLWFLSQFHSHRKNNIFKGDFSAYVIGHLHETFAGSKSAETIAAIYGLDLETVAGLAGIFRSPRRVRFQDRLRTAVRDGTAQDLIASHKRHCDILARYPELRRYG